MPHYIEKLNDIKITSLQTSPQCL